MRFTLRGARRGLDKEEILPEKAKRVTLQLNMRTWSKQVGWHNINHLILSYHQRQLRLYDTCTDDMLSMLVDAVIEMHFINEVEYKVARRTRIIFKYIWLSTSFRPAYSQLL